MKNFAALLERLSLGIVNTFYLNNLFLQKWLDLKGLKVRTSQKVVRILVNFQNG